MTHFYAGLKWLRFCLAMSLCAALFSGCGLSDIKHIKGIRSPVFGHQATDRDWAMASFAARLNHPELCLNIPANSFYLGGGMLDTRIIMMRSECIENIADDEALSDPELCTHVEQISTILFRSGNGTEESCREKAADFRPSKINHNYLGVCWYEPDFLGSLNLSYQDLQDICLRVSPAAQYRREERLKEANGEEYYRPKVSRELSDMDYFCDQLENIGPLRFGPGSELPGDFPSNLLEDFLRSPQGEPYLDWLVGKISGKTIERPNKMSLVKADLAKLKAAVEAYKNKTNQLPKYIGYQGGNVFESKFLVPEFIPFPLYDPYTNEEYYYFQPNPQYYAIYSPGSGKKGSVRFNGHVGTNDGYFTPEAGVICITNGNCNSGDGGVCLDVN